MKKFLIDPRRNKAYGHVDGEFIIHADNINKAADLAARRIFKRNYLIAYCQPFTDDKNGWFVACDLDRNTESLYLGSVFHVRLIDESDEPEGK